MTLESLSKPNRSLRIEELYSGQDTLEKIPDKLTTPLHILFSLGRSLSHSLPNSKNYQ
jgi:hypothetical protein